MKLVTTKFKSGGLHEKHVVATWNVGNKQRNAEVEKILANGRRVAKKIRTGNHHNNRECIVRNCNKCQICDIDITFTN